MAGYDVQAVWERDTGLPEDRVVNTFHLMRGAVTQEGGAFFDAAALKIRDFYGVGHPYTVGQNQRPLADYLSDMLTGDLEVRFYRAADPQPRPPAAIRQYTLSGLATAYPGSRLPEEVALCLSYRAVGAPGQEPARRRGRIFIGPLNEQPQVFAGMLRPSTGLRKALVAAGRFLFRPLPSPHQDCRYTGYSRVDDAQWDVDNGYVDDAFDTQRRRGPGVTFRDRWFISDF